MAEEDIQLNQARSTITFDLVEKILQNSKSDASIEVTNIDYKFATSKGDNYTSDMFRIFIDFTRDKGGKREALKEQLIVKFIPILEGAHQDLIAKSTLFDTEINMMTDTLQKMNQLLGPKHKLSGRGLYNQRKEPVFLVMEDLAPLGFRMADRQAGLDIEHVVLAIRGLARFHASSVRLCEKEPQLKKLYSAGMFNKAQPPEMAVFFADGMQKLAADMTQWPSIDRSYCDKIAKLAKNVYERACEVSKCDYNEFNVINHGDFWVNNMLFKYDDKGKPEKHIFVDFQLCNYASPAIDLQYFFNTSMTDDLLLNNEEMLLAEYRRVLVSTMQELGCTTMPPTMATLKAMMLQRSLYGLIASCTILPVLLVDKSKAVRLNEMLGEDGSFTNPGFASELFRQALSRRLTKFDDLGLFD